MFTRSVFLASILCAAGAGAADLRVGQPFPDIHFPTLSGGKLRSVASFRGRKLVLHVFASW